MRQMTEKEAAALGRSGDWKTWPDEQIVKVQLFQERICVDISRFSAALSVVLKRPVLRHELMRCDLLRAEYLGERPAPTWQEIAALIPPKRRILAFLWTKRHRP